jgi:ABC-type multidrug transport system, ATPase component
MNDDLVIEARSLSKSYGRERGIIGLDFAVERGEVFGLLGPNGAGKTTAIRLLLDLIRPSSGVVRMFGTVPRASPAMRRRVGYLPGDLRLYERLSGRAQLAYFAGLRGLDGLGRAEELADRLDVDLDRPLKTLSKGNRQKVGVVQAFMHDPELLILDEPTSGLDPLVQQLFYTLLDETREAGRTVLISSHVLPEVQRVADRVALLRDGRLVLEDTVEALRAHALVRVIVAFADEVSPDAFVGLPGVRELERHDRTIVFGLQGEPDALVKALAAHHVVTLASREADLEDVFLALYQEPVDAA